MLNQLPSLFFIPVFMCFLLMFFSIPGSIAGLEMSSFLLFCLLVLRELYLKLNRQKSVFVASGFHRYFLLLWLWIIISSYLAGLSSSVVYDSFVSGRFALVFIVVYTAIYMFPDKIRSLSPLFHIHFAWIAVYGTIQAFRAWEFPLGQGALPEIIRVQGFFSNTMTYSYVFGMWFCFFMANLITSRQKNWKSILLWLCCILMGISLIFTLTRGMWIAVLISCGIIALLSKGFKKKLMLAGLGLAMLVMLATPSIRSRVLSSWDLNNTSNSMRVEIWKAHLSVGLDHFWTGTGTGGKAEKLKKYYEKNPGQYNIISHAHNNYIEVFSSNGIIGLILYVGLFLCLTIKSLQIYLAAQNNELKKLALGAFAAQLVFHIGGLTECTFFDYEVVYSLIIICAVLIGVYRSKYLPKAY